MAASPAAVCGRMDSVLPDSLGCMFGTCEKVHNASLSGNESASVCVCRSGFVDDTSLGAFANCGMPAWWIPFCLYTFGSMSFLVFVSTLAVIRHLRQQTFRLAVTCLITTFFHMLACVAYLSQQFASGFYWLCCGIAIGGIIASVILWTFAFFQASYRTLNMILPERKVKWTLGVFCCLAAVPFLEVAFGTFAVQGESDPEAFNTIIACFFVLLPVHELVIVPLFIGLTRQLRSSLDSNKGGARQGNMRIDNLRRRVRLLEIINVYIMVPVIMSSSLGIFGLYFATKQIPFQFVFFFGFNAALSTMGLSTLYFATSQMFSVGSISSRKSLTFSSLAVPPGTSLMVKRRSDAVFSRMDGQALQLELGQQAEVIVDTGERVSVLGSEFADVDDANVLIARYPRVAKIRDIAEWLLAPWPSSAALEWRSKSNVLLSACFWIFLALGSLVVSALVLVNESTVVAEVMAIFGGLFIVAFWLVFASCFFSIKLLRARLFQTMWFRWRLFTTLICNAALGVALGDVRSLISFSNFALQITVYSGDALINVMSMHRLFLTALGLVNTVLVVLLIVLDAVPSTTLAWTISDSFDYNLLQLVRDMHVAQIIILIFEVLALFRGAHKRRFLHIEAPVSVTIRSIVDEAASERPRMSPFAAGASKVDLNESGYFVNTDPVQATLTAGSQELAPAPAQGNAGLVHVFVNSIEIQQSDALVFHVLPRPVGKIVYDTLTGRTRTLIYAIIYNIGFVVVFTLPLLAEGSLPWWFPLLCLPSIVTLPIMTLGVSSRTLIALLVKRRRFRVAVVFLAIWFGLSCSVFQDARIALVVFVLECSLLDLLSDAKTTKPGRSGARLSRTYDRLVTAGFFAALAAMKVFGAVHSRQLYVVFRPDLESVNGTKQMINPDAPFVIDLFQSLVDMEIALCLEKLLGFVLFAFFYSQDTMYMVARPVIPRFVTSAERIAQVHLSPQKSGPFF